MFEGGYSKLLKLIFLLFSDSYFTLFNKDPYFSSPIKEYVTINLFIYLLMFVNLYIAKKRILWCRFLQWTRRGFRRGSHGPLVVGYSCCSPLSQLRWRFVESDSDFCERESFINEEDKPASPYPHGFQLLSQIKPQS